MNHKLKLPIWHLIFKNRNVKERGEELELEMRTQCLVNCSYRNVTSEQTFKWSQRSEQEHTHVEMMTLF